MNRLLVAAVSFAATALFFWEYLPWTKRVQFFADIDGYHYPLYTYAHRAIQERRLPEWDWSLYCGIPYIANPQTAFFYPPNWLVHLANRKHSGIRFWTLEALAILHFWIAFFTAWLWLRHRARSDLGASVGAGLFAFGGYMTGEAQHLGAICAYAWFPLGLHAIDRASVAQLAIASALCWLAGYPSTWLVFCVCVAAYAFAVEGWRRVAWTAGGIASSLGIVAIQLAPALEAAANKVKDNVYGAGLPGGWFFAINFLLPNYYDQSPRTGRYGLDFEQYLYLGAVPIAALFFARQWKPALAILAACLFFAEDPLRLWTTLANRYAIVGDALREWNFLAGIFTGLALLAASGASSLQGKTPAWPRPVVLAAIAAALAWSARQLWLWNHGATFLNGWASAIEVAVTAAIGFILLRAGPSRFAAAVLLLLLWTDYKVYGTSRRFNAVPGARDIQFRDDARTGGQEFLGIPSGTYQALRENRHYRILFADIEWANEARHYGLLSPQGADPLVPPAYKRYVESFVPFSTNRLFPLDWRNPAMLDAFGVRYIISSKLLEAPHLRLFPETQSYYHKVYEFPAARPIYRFDGGTARHVDWLPERRAFQVDSLDGGPLVLLENLAPGWHATIDGAETAITAESGTFQRIQIPPGSHRVEFRYRSQALRFGAAITVISLIGLAVFCLRRRPPLLQS